MKFVPSVDGRSDREKRLYPYTVEDYVGHWAVFLNGTPVVMVRQSVEKEEDQLAKEKALLWAFGANMKNAASKADYVAETSALQTRMRERHKRLNRAEAA